MHVKKKTDGTKQNALVGLLIVVVVVLCCCFLTIMFIKNLLNLSITSGYSWQLLLLSCELEEKM